MATRNERVQIVVDAKNQAKGVLSSVKNQVLAIGAAYLGWKAVTGIIGSIVEKGMESEQAWNDVAAALRRHGHEVDSNITKIQAFAGQMQAATGRSDEFIGKAVQSFIDYGQSVDEAMKTTQVALDLAAGGGMNLASATDLLAKAAVGYTSTLSRYGIIIDENIPKSEKFAAAIAQINERFGGAAAAQADNVATKISLLTERFGDLQEEIFTLISPALFSGLESAIGLVNGLIGIFTDESVDQIRQANKAFEETAGNTLRMADRYDELASKEKLTSKEQEELNRLLEELAKLQPGIVERWDAMGRAIDISTDALRDNIREQRTINQLAEQDALKKLGDAYKDNLSAIRDNIETIKKYREESSSALTALSNKSFDYQGAIENLSAEIQSLRYSQKQYVSEASGYFPELAADTDQYAFAVRMLGEDLARIVLLQQTLGKTSIDLDSGAGFGKFLSGLTSMVSTTRETTSQVASLFDQLAAHVEFDEINDEYEDALVGMQRSTEERNERFNELWAEHQNVRRSIEEAAFQASIAGMTDYHATVATLEHDRAAEERVLRQDQYLGEEELQAALYDLDVIYGQRRQELLNRQIEQFQAQWYERWSILTEQVSTFSHNLTQVLITDSNNLRDMMHDTFEQIGQSIAHNLVDRGLKAIWKFIAGQAAQRTATILLGATQKAQMVAETVSTTTRQAHTKATAMATAITASLTAATGALTAASGVAVAAMGVESIAVRALTKHYIALASAKAAATLGISAGPSIAAAATVKASLTAMLTGFDDPINDSIAYRHGQDYAKNFIKGAQSRFGAPQFGMEVRSGLSRVPSSSQSAPAQGNTYITVRVEGNVVADDTWVQESLVPAIERASGTGHSRVALKNDNRTGRSALRLR